MQRNPSLYLHIHCRAINIFISHDLLPSDLVAQSVEQRRSNPKVVVIKSHPGQSFPLSLCGPISMLMQRNPSLSLSINTASWLLTLSKIAIVNSEVTGAKLVTLRGYFRSLFWSVKMRNPE